MVSLVSLLAKIESNRSPNDDTKMPSILITVRLSGKNSEIFD